MSASTSDSRLSPEMFERQVLSQVAAAQDGLPLTLLAERNGSEESGDAEYQRTRRVLQRNDDLLKIDSRNGIIWVAPTPSLLNLKTAGQKSKHAEGAANSRDTPKKLLEDVKLLNSEGKQILLDRYSAYLRAIEDQRIALEHRNENREEYKILKYRTRWTDEARADRLWSRYHEAWENATDEYERAVAVTLTTDPKKHDSLRDSWDSLQDSWNRLMSWLSTNQMLGERPDYICVREPQEQGNPHIHAILFGVSYLMDSHRLSNYWDKHQGKIVHLMGFRNRRGDWKHINDDSAEDSEETDGKGYLGKYLSKLLDLNEKDSDEIHGADADDEPSWKLAIYWALGKRLYTTSENLLDDDPSPELPHVPKWEYHGAYPSEMDIPAYVIRNLSARKQTPKTPKPPDDRGDDAFLRSR